MKIQIQYGNGVCTIPLRALTEENAERVDLLVLMHLSAEPSLADNPELLASKVGCSRKNAESGLNAVFLPKPTNLSRSSPSRKNQMSLRHIRFRPKK